MLEPWKHYAKWNKPDTKGQMVYEFHFNEVLRIGTFTETESRTEVTRDWKKNRELLSHGFGVSVWDDETFLGMNSGENCTTLWVYLMPPNCTLKNGYNGASLVAQWLRICLPVQGTWVRALVWEDPTCRGATRPVSHNYWACASGACAPQQERPRWWEARAPRWRVAPTCRN